MTTPQAPPPCSVNDNTSSSTPPAMKAMTTQAQPAGQMPSATAPPSAVKVNGTQVKHNKPTPSHGDVDVLRWVDCKPFVYPLPGVLKTKTLYFAVKPGHCSCRREAGSMLGHHEQQKGKNPTPTTKQTLGENHQRFQKGKSS